MKSKLAPAIDTSTVGVVMRFDNAEDTSVVAASVEKGLEDCGFHSFGGIFRNEIYEESNFQLLLRADSAFLSSQPTLNHLNQIVVVNTHIIRKKDDKGKNSIGVEMLGKWISLTPIGTRHTFYYAEKMNSTGDENDVKTVISYLSGQILKKLCIDIHQHVFKTK